MGKHSKTSHHHKPAIERAVPIERIVELFSKRFDDPYLNPSAELTFEHFTAGFPDLPREELVEALTYWTSHSGEKLLQTKTAKEGEENSRVWYIHGLTRRNLTWSNPASDRLQFDTPRLPGREIVQNKP